MSDSYIYNKIDNKYYQKLVAYSEPIETNATVDLNNEWIKDSEDNEYNYFKSNSIEFEPPFSQCKVTWSNLTSVTFKYMSSSSSDVGVLFVGKLDGEKFTLQTNPDEDVYQSTIDKTTGIYNEFTIECDEREHHIWFAYAKNESVTNEDRGFIGVPKSVIKVLDIKQGSELPMERNYGGVSAEGGKTYDIYFNKVTVPNGSIVGDYENVEKTEKSINTEYVDLGLESGTLWAKCNIGASSETEDGVYFQWGETSGVSETLVGKYSDENYSWASYTHCNGSSTTLKKYNNDSSCGTVDNKTTLDTEDDAARANMGGDWRMPTRDELLELYNNTTNEWVTNFDGTGVNGRKFISRIDSDKYIFFPASGYADGSGVIDRGSYGYFWSSVLHPSYVTNHGLNLLIYSGGVLPGSSNYRCNGLSVRGVRK